MLGIYGMQSQVHYVIPAAERSNTQSHRHNFVVVGSVVCRRGKSLLPRKHRESSQASRKQFSRETKLAVTNY